MYIYIHIHIYICIYIYIYVCMYVCMYIYSIFSILLMYSTYTFNIVFYLILLKYI